MGHFTSHPKAGTVIKAEELAEHFSKILSMSSRVESGFTVTTSGTSLSATLQEGKAFIAGYEVGEAGNGGETLTLTASSTNHVYLDETGAVTVNTTGVAPNSTAIKLWEIATNASGVTGTTDKRDFNIRLGEIIKAKKFEATDTTHGHFEGMHVHLFDSNPFVYYKDTSTGDTFKTSFQNNLYRFQTGDQTTTYYTFDKANNRFGFGKTPAAGAKIDVAGSVRTDTQFISTVATGTSPFSVASTTLVTNLNAHMLGGKTLANLQSDFVDAAGDTMTGNLTFANNIGVVGTNTTGTTYALMNLDGGNTVGIGNTSLPLKAYSSVDPTIKVGAATATAMWHDGNTDARVTTVKIAGAAVTTAKIADANVTTAKIANGNVTLAKVADGAFTADLTGRGKFAAGFVDTSLLADLNVTTAKLADSAVTTTKINDAAVTTAKLLNDGVTAAKLASDAITDANRAVTTDHIRDSAVTTVKIAGSGVTTAKIADLNVTTAKLADGAVTDAKVASATLTAGKIASSQVVKSIAFGTGGTLRKDAVTVTDSDIVAALGYTPADSAGDASSWSGTQDFTGAKILHAGADEKYETELVDGALNQKVLRHRFGTASGSVDGEQGKILWQHSDFAATPVLTDVAEMTKTEFNVLQALKRAGNIVWDDANSDGRVTTVKLAASAVTTAKIADLNVTTAKLADLGVTTAKLADSSVTSAKIADGTIVDADVSTTAAIGWSKVSKTGSSLADLVTRSASDLSSGTLADARLPSTMSAKTFSGLATLNAGAKLPNAQYVQAVDAETTPATHSILGIDSASNMIVGTTGRPAILKSSVDPTVKVGAATATAIWHSGNVTAGTGIAVSGTTISTALTAGTGISISGATVTNSDLGSSQNIFKNVADSAGTSQFSAASNSDTVRFASSGIVSTAFDALTKKVTFSASLTAGGGITVSGSTISHTDTSAQASSSNTGATVIQSVGLDTYGHVTSLGTKTLSYTDVGAAPTSHTHDDRYYTESESDSRFANVTGDTFTGNVVFDIPVDGSSPKIRFTGNTDTFEIFAEERAGESEGSALVIYASDNGDTDYVAFRNRSGATTVDVLHVKHTHAKFYKPVYVDNNLVWHDGNVTAGGGIGISSRTISHADTSAQGSVNNSGATVIQDVTLDGYGHVTALGSKTLSYTDVGAAPSSHTHDDRYYTESESDGRFMRIATASTVTARHVFKANSASQINTSTGSLGAIEVQAGLGYDAFMSFHVSGDYAAYFGLDGADNKFKVGGWSMGANAYQIWHEGNQGSGSGLDADTVDGWDRDTIRNYGNILNKPAVEPISGSYGSVNLNGTTGGYSGFYSPAVGRYFMMHGQYQGSYTGTAWQWRFNNGALDVGTVPAGSITGQGSGGGLHADLLDGYHASEGATGSTIVARNSNGYIFATYLNAAAGDTTDVSRIAVKNSTDTYYRWATQATIRTFLGLGNAAYHNEGSGNGLDADMVDGKHVHQIHRFYLPMEAAALGDSNVSRSTAGGNNAYAVVLTYPWFGGFATWVIPKLAQTTMRVHLFWDSKGQSGNVKWQVKANGVTNGDTWDANVVTGAAVEEAAYTGSTYSLTHTAVDVPHAAGEGVGEMLRVVIERVDAASNDLSGDARLVMAYVEWL